MFGDQRMRLQRFFDGGTVQGLAEELFAMMDAEIANTTESPVVVNLPEGQEGPWRANGYDDGDTLFDINRGGIKISIEGNKLILERDGRRHEIGSGGGGGGSVPVWG